MTVSNYRVCSKVESDGPMSVYSFKDFPKSKLISELGQHYRCVPPIKEACECLQQFLQEDFPKLMRNISPSSSSTSLCASKLLLGKSSSLISNDSEEPLSCGSFSVLPVKYHKIYFHD